MKIIKKIILSFIVSALSISCFAQKSVTIKGGTIVPLEAVKSVRAIDVHEGESVDFKTSSLARGQKLKELTSC